MPQSNTTASIKIAKGGSDYKFQTHWYVFLLMISEMQLMLKLYLTPISRYVMLLDISNISITCSLVSLAFILDSLSLVSCFVFLPLSALLIFAPLSALSWSVVFSQAFFNPKDRLAITDSLCFLPKSLFLTFSPISGRFLPDKVLVIFSFFYSDKTLPIPAPP